MTFTSTELLRNLECFDPLQLKLRGIALTTVMLNLSSTLVISTVNSNAPCSCNDKSL